MQMFSRKRTLDREMGFVTNPLYTRNDAEDHRVDFSNAALYLGGLQTVFTVCVCAVVSVLSCWLVPTSGVSAVRTLALCCFVGFALMRKPLRIGRAHGVTVVFESLQIAIPLYLSTQVIEQLIHTCASSNDSSAPSWRRVIFHVAQLVLMISGFLRARRPMADTDVDFILTVTTLLVIAMLPPPSIAFVGPLCQSVTLWEAADRVIRAFVFSIVYCVNVYSLTSSQGIYVSETQVVVTRSASASIWVLGSHVVWLPFSIAQCVIIIYARVHQNDASEKLCSISGAMTTEEYSAIDTAASTDDENGENAIEVPTPMLDDPVDELNRMLSEPQLYTPIVAATTTTTVPTSLAAPVAVSMAAPASRPQTPAEECQPRGPRSFQLVSGSQIADVAPPPPTLMKDYDFHDRAAEIAERIA
jgi:hypothetical protein